MKQFASSYRNKIVLVFIFLNSVIVSCKKFVQVSPPSTSITSATAYEGNSSAAAVLTGVYSTMATTFTFAGGTTSIGYLCGNAADELTNYTSSSVAAVFYSNSYNPANFNYFWPDLYSQIYVSNSAIQGISKSHGLSQPLKNQLLGEAKFLRAFLHFYAANLFGDVPLVTTTNYQTNNVIHRSPSQQVYMQIVGDLNDAQHLLTTGFVDPTGASTAERTRPNQGAASALLARVYLYEKKWDSAEAEAGLVIGNSNLYSLGSLNGIFLKNSTEAIWQLQCILPGYNTFDANYYILTSNPGTGYYNVALSPGLLNAFEPGDSRYANWIGSFKDPRTGQIYYYPYKYKIGSYNRNRPVTEYEMVFRLAEQYLIRAEARANLGNLSGAAGDLNIIRNRAGLPNTTASTQTDLLNAIYNERRVELFTEWGHRWFDLNRTNNLNAVMSNIAAQKGAAWSSYKSIYPIPLSEIQLNGNLTQNPGYN